MQHKTKTEPCPPSYAVPGSLVTYSGPPHSRAPVWSNGGEGDTIIGWITTNDIVLVVGYLSAFDVIIWMPGLIGSIEVSRLGPI